MSIGTTVKRCPLVGSFASNAPRRSVVGILMALVLCAYGCPSAAPPASDPGSDAAADGDPTNEPPNNNPDGDGSPDSPASAQVAFEFQVTVTFSRAEAIQVGQQGVGRIAYDPADAVGFGSFEAPPAVFELELGSVRLVAGSRASEFPADVQVDVRNDRVVIVDREEMDALVYWGNNIARELDGLRVDMALALHDTSGTALSEEALPTVVPTLSEFDQTHVQIRFETPEGAWQSLADLSVDEITVGSFETGGGDDAPADDSEDTADTFYVDDDAPPGGNGASWGAAFRYLQDALAAAGAGDEVRVAQGTYRPDRDDAGNVTSGDRWATFRLAGGVAIYGGYAGLGAADPDVRDLLAHKSVLSGALAAACATDAECEPPDASCVNGVCEIPGTVQNSFHVVTGSGAPPTAILGGFTITGGIADGEHPYDVGAGMYHLGGSPTVTDCTFEENAAYFGGGMYNDDGSPTITNCTFIRNRASGFRAAGGAMSNTRSNPTVTACDFIGNSASGTGGAMYNNEQSSPTVTGCRFNGNSAGEGGGGMYNIVNSHATVTNCVFSGNASQLGGGMYNHISSQAVVTNCTFTRNSAPFTSGALVSRDSGETVTNCIFWNNGNEPISDVGMAGTPRITYSIVEGGWPGVGNLDLDPLFFDFDGLDDIAGTIDDDLRLLPGSPAIDAGSNAALPEGVVTDVDGNPRQVDDPSVPDCPEPGSECGAPPIVDLGAFESPAGGP